MKVYLDTSACRALGRRLSDAPVIGDAYISALTFVELLGMLEGGPRAFAGVQNVVRSLNEAHVKRVWSLPEQMVFIGFTNLSEQFEFAEDRTGELQRILDHLVAAPDFQHFGAAIADGGLRMPYERLRAYDKWFGETFVSATIEGHRSCRAALKAASAEDHAVLREIGIDSTGSFAEFCRSFAAHEVNEAATRLALTRHALGLLPGDVDRDALERETFDAYNGRLDIFAAALSFTSMDLLQRGAQPGRNDMLDLAHFLYLPPKVRLLTNDKRMREVASAIGVELDTTPLS